MKFKTNTPRAVQVALAIAAILAAFVISGHSVSFAVEPEQARRGAVCSDVGAGTAGEVIVGVERGDTLLLSELKFYFNINSSLLNVQTRENANELALLDRIIESDASSAEAQLYSISIKASASIDGLEHNNQLLAQNRADAVRDFLLQRYPTLSADKVTTVAVAEDWEGFRAAVIEDFDVPQREKVLEVIDDTRRSADNKEWYLRTMQNGGTWQYLTEHILAQQRYSAPMVISHNKELCDIIGTVNLTTVPQRAKFAIPQPSMPYLKYEPSPQEYELKPLFALKTNLLFDAATLLNAEIEVPIGNRISVLGEWIGPWWVFDNGKEDSPRSRIQAKIGTLEGRYWLGGNREIQPLLTGFFVGIYGTLGSYDFEFNKKGVQSQDLVSYGVTAGYAHTINKSGTLRLEYSLGLGVMTSTYKEYTAEFQDGQWWKAYRDATKSLSWFGPTRAKVSLVWMINYKKQK